MPCSWTICSIIAYDVATSVPAAAAASSTAIITAWSGVSAAGSAAVGAAPPSSSACGGGHGRCHHGTYRSAACTPSSSIKSAM